MPLPHPIGLLTKSDLQRALALAAEGVTLAGIRATLGIGRRAWLAALETPGFREELEAIRKLALEERAEELLRVHEEIEDIQKARLYSTNLQWYLERRLPDEFGKRDKVDVNVNISLKDAISGVARRRQALGYDQPPAQLEEDDEPPAVPTNAKDLLGE